MLHTTSPVLDPRNRVGRVCRVGSARESFGAVCIGACAGMLTACGHELAWHVYETRTRTHARIHFEEDSTKFLYEMKAQSATNWPRHAYLTAYASEIGAR